MKTATTDIVPVIVVLPRRDSDDVRLDLRIWVTEAIAVLSDGFGPTATFDDDPEVVLVVCESDERHVNQDEQMGQLRELLHRFGRDTRASSVGAVIGNHLYEITEFDREIRHEHRTGATDG